LDTTTADQTTGQLKTPTYFEVREQFASLVLHDLHGPANGPEEELDEKWVLSRYLVGWLAPKDVGRGTRAAEERATVRDDQAAPLPDDNPLNPVSNDAPLGSGSDESGEEGIGQ
jgi:hypothetical protein